jgi:glyoxylase-like metal-dependent hydrolase (beta-lactamase superfamily II)
MVMTITAPLTWEVFVAPAELTVTDDLPPGAQHRAWSPISATLLVGEHHAVLVDPLMTTTQAQVLAGWVAATGKNLATVYVTHGHGDHFFGLGVLLDRFPGARAVAAPAVVERMRQSMTAESVALWARRFPGQIPTRLVIAEALTDGGFELEGHELVAVDLGHTDTDDTTCLHVPDIGLVVAGDAVYNDVHLYLAESEPDRTREWLAALDTIEALKPRAVVSGHKRAIRNDGPETIEETRRYIRDFDRVAATTSTAHELYAQMLAIHPHRVNPGALWTSARAVKP